MSVKYKGGRVVAVRKRMDTVAAKELGYGYAFVENIFGQHVYQIDRDTYAKLAVQLLFQRFCEKPGLFHGGRGWLYSCGGLDYDALTVQLAVEIERAGLAPEKEFEHHDPNEGYGVNV